MPKHINLTNHKYGKLTVLYLDNKTQKADGRQEYMWFCKCDCGQTKIIPGCNLRNGWTKSCGCLTKPEDITGYKYGKLTVIGFDKEIKTKNKIKYYWNCLCECGKTKSVYVNYLRSGKYVSCGCLKQVINLQGKKYGRLIVIGYEGKRKNKHYWKCLCDCGKEIITSGNALKTRNATSCGCLRKDTIRKKKLIDITGNKYGKLKVIKYEGDNKWLCKCDCGKQKIICGYYIRSGKTKSCGCGQGKDGITDRSWNADPLIRLRHNISCNIRMALQSNCGSKQGESIFKYLPYNVQNLKEHLEKQFEPWMNWENYGGKANNKSLSWHVDHIVPQSSFNFTSMEDKTFQECWALSNLRPLEKIANIRKGNRKCN